MRTPSFINIVVTGLVAASAVSGFDPTGRSGLACRHVGALLALAAPALAFPVVDTITEESGLQVREPKKNKNKKKKAKAKAKKAKRDLTEEDGAENDEAVELETREPKKNKNKKKKAKKAKKAKRGLGEEEGAAEVGIRALDGDEA
ncbi:hypothetical protein MAPG_08358 [Magnaporthiopsis poae ATCC 64411]|uniref:Uncharacterized protein n=1 Tax=Magnaporthiopsis poae (strain ATCC 64411 / 73-15) TaxID=644358 RepID=A0A0C4E756_MAGP6|nr:hypothetical protein MAPG_08358 [Magnaporthiopsis poae ATCC 64411]